MHSKGKGKDKGKGKKRILLFIQIIIMCCFGLLSLIFPNPVFAADQDYDGIADDVDNCPTMGNPLQTDLDGDGIGLVCDTLNDQDSDGITDDTDNCPTDPNPLQRDLDGDGIGLVCDTLNDQDSDGITDDIDNCPTDPNPLQKDLDGDGIGLVCDTLNDQDSDGITDDIDNCPTDPNPLQKDPDGDGIGLVCDDDTINNQATINRMLFFESKAMGDRQRALSFESMAMDDRLRALSFESRAIDAREGALALERKEMASLILDRNLVGFENCLGCHATTLGGRRRLIVGENGDFSMASHHVQGTPTVIDCLVCHYTGDHRSGIVKLVDADQWTDVIYEYDPSAPENIGPFCLSCHDGNGMFAGFGNVPFSDGVAVPDVASSHYGQTCVDCHSRESGFNAHLPAHGGGSGTGCETCHGHDSGYEYSPGLFSQGRGTTHSHSTHTENDADDIRGPNVTCDACHDTNNFPYFKSGVDSDGDGLFNLSETDVCNTCHSPGGSYDGVNGSSFGAKDNWHNGIYVNGNLSIARDRWCVSCHDEIPSDIRDVPAPNIAGNESAATNYGTGYGYYKTGHGLPINEEYPASGGLTMGAGMMCTECHDTGLAHIDGVARTYSAAAVDGASNDYRHGYRLKMVGLQLPLNIPREAATESWEPANAADFALCVSCHEFDPYGNNDSTDTNFRSTNIITQDIGIKNAHYYHLSSWGGLNSPDWDSDWSGTIGALDGDSRPSCPTCHNVHGSPQLAMVRDGQLVGREPGLPIAYYDSGVNFDPACSGLPFPMDLKLNASTGTMYDPTGPANFCGNCHGGCWDTTMHTPYMRDPSHYANFNDSDGDGISDVSDNCPVIINPYQEDTDSDGVGDACDICPADANNVNIPIPDSDADGIGDNCDICLNDVLNDADGDGICGSADSCPNDYYNDSQDLDGVCGDEDNCPTVYNPAQEDADSDGVGDLCDNCPAVFNPNQIDSDGDGIGNLCDTAAMTPMIVGGYAHSVALKSDGTVWAWGKNDLGQTGDGGTINHHTPTQVLVGVGTPLVDITAIATDEGSNHTLALKSDGTVWTWGNNSSGQLGAGSTGTASAYAVQVIHPTDPTGFLTDIVDIAAAKATSAAVKSDGTVWAWGESYAGQLGTGSLGQPDTNQPVQVKDVTTNFLTNVVSIAGGDQHFVTIKDDGSVWTWGMNDNSGVKVHDPDPARPHWNGWFLAYESTDYPATGWDYNNVTDVEAGFYLTVLINEENGQGKAHAMGRSVPASNFEYGLMAMEALTDPVSKLAAGREHVLALRDDGTIWGGGYNCDGQLGTGVPNDCMAHQTAVQTPGLTDIIAIGSGWKHSLAVKDNGDGSYSYWAWGANGSGQTGVSASATELSPVQVTGL
jgi:alpha-tubulin suppressor-like RCC1 family protein